MAQEDRKPFYISSSMNIPFTTSNETFAGSAAGNLDWKNSFNILLKKKNTLHVLYKRTNFKLGSLSNKFNTDVKSKYILNSFGIGYSRSFVDNDYVTVSFGLNAYYAATYYHKIVVNNVELKQLTKNYYQLEPTFIVAYKASRYVDIAFHISETLSNYVFDPFEMQLDKSTIGISYDSGISSKRLSFLSFGFQVNWFLEFEKEE